MLVQTADVLDLHLEIDSSDKFKVLFYDKRDKYEFNVIRFYLGTVIFLRECRVFLNTFILVKL